MHRMKKYAIYIFIILVTLLGADRVQGANCCTQEATQQNVYRECYNEDAIERLATILDASSLALPHNIAVTGNKHHSHNYGKTGNGNGRYTASAECNTVQQQRIGHNRGIVATGVKRGKEYYIYALRQILI